MDHDALPLARFPLHLGGGGAALVLPEYTGMPEWYQAYEAAHGGEGGDGRLVSLHRFAEDWPSWEMHPLGEEVVICTEGALTLIQELTDGSVRRIQLAAGDYAINPAGVWHTADVSGPCTAIFITPGMGTQHRGR